MKKFITIPSIFFHSFLVVFFAACGANANKKAEICSHQNSEIFIAENKLTEDSTRENSHPMVVPNSHNIEDKPHPMVISPCEHLEEKGDN